MYGKRVGEGGPEVLAKLWPHRKWPGLCFRHKGGPCSGVGGWGSAVEHSLIDVFKSLWRVGGRGLRVEAGRPARRLFYRKCSAQHLAHNKHS